MKKVLVVGTRGRLDEFREISLENAQVSYLDQFYLEPDEVKLLFDGEESPDDEYYISEVDPGNFDVVFDLSLDDNPENLDIYAEYAGLVVVGGAVKTSLAEIADNPGFELECKLVGINALPTFINRDRFELSLLNEEDREWVAKLMQELGRAFEIVDDRVGMVTPRVVCMIINEACFVLKEGTAGIKDVDLAMKLGTNYPYGPFEWADKIGIHNVYDVLEALKDDTGEEKYKMAPLLRQYYLRDQEFYS